MLVRHSILLIHRRWRPCVLLIKVKGKITSGVPYEEWVYRFSTFKGSERCGAETAMYVRLNSW